MRKIFIIAVMFLGVSSGFINCNVVLAADEIEFLASNTLTLTPETTFLPGKDAIYLQLTDGDVAKADKIKLKLVSSVGADTEEVILFSRENSPAIFVNNKGLNISAEDRVIGDGILQVSPSGDTITVICPDNPAKTVLAVLTSLPLIDRFLIKADSLQTAGSPFRLEIIAHDYEGNIVRNYRGSVEFKINYVSPAQGKYGLIPQGVSAFINGKAQILAVYPDAGILEITAIDTANISGKSEKIIFMPAKFKLEASTPQVVGRPFDLEITALNCNNEITFGYEGDALLAPLNREDIGYAKKVKFNNGKAVAKVIHDNWGIKKFIAFDEKKPSLAGRSSDIFFTPHTFKIEIFPPPAHRDKFYAEELFKGKITVLDYRGDKIPDYGGLIAFSKFENIDTNDSISFDRRFNGESEFTISALSAGIFSIGAYDVHFPQVKAESAKFSIMSAELKPELVYLKSAKAKVRIKIVDKNGRQVINDDSTRFKAHLIEEVADNSASIAGAEEITAKKGAADIIVTNTEKEKVTVMPESEPYLEAGYLDITF